MRVHLQQRDAHTASPTALPARAARTAAPRTGGPDLLALQRKHGNSYVQRLVTGWVQPKLRVGGEGDAQECEADRVANLVAGGSAAPPFQLEPSDPVRARGGAAAPADAPVGVERAVSAAGGDRPLPQDVRAEFETAFGADLSSVRVHTGSTATNLNRELGSVAFTHGQNVFFDAGQYRPGTPQGRWLLAHEITHVVQQGGAVGPIRRKLDWQHTNWGLARKAWSSSGGFRGVLFVTDVEGDDPVVIKSGDDSAVENVLATNLHNMFGLGEQWSSAAPRARIAGADEREQMKYRLSHLVADDERGQVILKDVLQPGTVVFEYVRGRQFGEMVASQEKHTEKSGLGGRSIRKGSPLALFTSEGFMRKAGRISAIDIFMGSFDRFVGKFNAENFLVDAEHQSIATIDNLEANFMHQFSEKADWTRAKALKQWQGWVLVNHLKANRFDEIADNMSGAFEGTFLDDLRLEDRAPVRELVKKMRPAFAAGVKEGKNDLYHLLQRKGEAAQGIADGPREQIMESIVSRLTFLFT